ncbi:MFS transporter [Actinobacteria bacterium YIM 96077]|uniref:Multidrug efflux pump Tap n=1 Tax=Phytoactinopolyspora halophila TaxID=1981511 RepID=A0A329QYD6_9ACTN|nr:MFS transporter [Phytoactinopolyspora halophila]AYY12874.1 MFS transporter [Actinobacteria bacterium YIM 96077]RAW16332.1 MFS transporter [Phytoactinopolyspora halophila]
MSDPEGAGHAGREPREPREPRSLYGLLAANIVSLAGTRLSMIALPWYVITSTGDAVNTGLAAFAQMTPYVLAKALAGPVVDRLGPRRVTIVAEIAGAAAIGLIPVLHAADALPFGTFLVLVALVGMASGPADGAKSAMIPAVAERAQVPLERVTGLTGTIERLASTIGAAAAGSVVAFLGAAPALAVNAVTFVFAAVIVMATAPSRYGPHTRVAGGYLGQFREGASFIWRDRLLRAIYMMTSITNLLDAATFSVLLPVWAHSSGRGPAEIGLLAAAFGAAAVAASMLAAAIGHRMPRRATYLASFLIAGAPRFIVLVLDVPLSTIVSVYVVSGFAAGFINPILGAVIFARIPADLVGRVSALGTSLAWAGVPFGGLAGGAITAAVGLSPALIILGIAYLVTTILPGLQRSWREMDRR